MIDITDDKGNIRSEFMNLSREEWAALYHYGQLPSRTRSGGLMVDRRGDLVESIEHTQFVHQQTTDMPAPMISLASFPPNIVSPLPMTPYKLGILGNIGLFTVTAVGLDRVPLSLGIASLVIPGLILLL